LERFKERRLVENPIPYSGFQAFQYLLANGCREREDIMRKLSIYATLVVLVLTCLFFVTTALAGRSGKGNGFPSGEHYNLNIIGKKEGFNCPPDEFTYTAETPDQNVIYIPVDNADAIQIYMESGKKKEIDNYTEFKVTDWCAGFGDAKATLMLRANQEGYAVFARAVGKLADGLNIKINDPNLDFVKDENGNDLLALGLVTPSGVTSFLSGEEIIFRKKGKSNKAVPITDLFMWSGSICYFSVEDTGLYKCCKDTTVPPDDIYDECIDPVDTVCPTGYFQEYVSCVTYPPTWIFNVADFVSYFWNVDNNGVKVLQIRFYPLPLRNQ
jgi:hypothetical protein